MEENSNSFLCKIIGKNTYHGFREFNTKYLVIYFIVLCVLYLLSNFVYWKFFSTVLSILSGSTIPYALFIFCVILKLDKPYEVKKGYTFKDEEYNQKRYRRSKLRGIALAICAALSMYFTEQYSDKYDFECSEFKVDITEGSVHLLKDCDLIDYNHTIKTMKGHEFIDEDYQICEACEDACSSYESDRYFRR